MNLKIPIDRRSTTTYMRAIMPFAIRHLLKKLYQPIFVFLLVPLFLSGCAESQKPSSGASLASNGNFQSPLPTRFEKHLSGNLTAEVEVDGRVIALTVDLDGTGACGAQGVCGLITDIAEGIQTFTLRFKIGDIVVATATASGTIVSEGSTDITFSALSYPDDDGDGFTNLAEIEANTDPLSASSRPPAESPRFSKNYAMTEQVGFSPVVGSVSSMNYSIR